MHLFMFHLIHWSLTIELSDIYDLQHSRLFCLSFARKIRRFDKYKLAGVLADARIDFFVQPPPSCKKTIILINGADFLIHMRLL